MTAALTLRTVYVEGDDDLAVLTRWFPAVQFKKAGGKEEVRRRVEHSEWAYGLLDRDFATDAQVAASVVPDSRLVILSRYCIENYLLEPDTIVAALTQHPLSAGQPVESWLDETHIRHTFHGWGDLLALYAAANAIVAQWRERITLDRDLGFLRYFGPLPPVSRAEVLASLHRRLAALTPIDEVANVLDANLAQVTADVQTWVGLHRWINGKVLLEEYLFPQVFAQLRLSQDRTRDLLIEAGRMRIPAELQELSRRWTQ